MSRTKALCGAHVHVVHSVLSGSFEQIKFYFKDLGLVNCNVISPVQHVFYISIGWTILRSVRLQYVSTALLRRHTAIPRRFTYSIYIKLVQRPYGAVVGFLSLARRFGISNTKKRINELLKLQQHVGSKLIYSSFSLKPI